MKKMLALVLALMMMLVGSAFAEETVSTEPAAVMTFDETAVTYEGLWLNFEDDGFSLYMPADAVEVELTEEDYEKGVFYAYQFANGVLVITCGEVGEEYTLEQVIADMQNSGYTGVAVAQFNDMIVVGGDNEESAVSAMSWLDGFGYMYVVTCSPTSDADFAAIAPFVMSSLTSYVAEEDVG